MPWNYNMSKAKLVLKSDILNDPKKLPGQIASSNPNNTKIDKGLD